MESSDDARPAEVTFADLLKDSEFQQQPRTSETSLVLAGHWFEVRLNQWPTLGELRISDLFGNQWTQHSPSLGYLNGGQGLQPGPLAPRFREQVEAFRAGASGANEDLADVRRTTVDVSATSSTGDGVLDPAVVEQPHHHPVEGTTDPAANRLDHVSSHDTVEHSDRDDDVPVPTDVRLSLGRDENVLDVENRGHERFVHDASPSAEDCGDHSVGERQVAEPSQNGSATPAAGHSNAIHGAVYAFGPSLILILVVGLP
ncbi:hypothetical protein [Rhodococcus sp. 2G]|uniref:hypothetical protein n=1 Tax=Rhodococcus sp. 2G TaxID=1570939 RepID=UPI0012EC7939|nr:hypothetical protein [Rhodococcus sp. 2G]